MRQLPWPYLRHRTLRWFRSVHAKLFIVTGLATSVVTLGVAYTITRNSRAEMLDYTRHLAIQTSMAVEKEILERDSAFQDSKKIKELLDTLAGTDKSIDQIDVFRTEVSHARASASRVTLVASSAADADVVWSPELGRFMNTPGGEPTARLVNLVDADEDNPNPKRPDQVYLGWEVFLPIANPVPKRPPIGLVRTYCDLERWEVVWRNNLERTYRILPMVLVVEFLMLWVILSWLLNRPLKKITRAMTRLELGDVKARADVARKDELGRIAGRFNEMAAQLEKASTDREALIGEIQGLNAGLQERIDQALQELQGKNEELESLLRRIALLREELGQAERLAVAGQLTAAFAHEVGTPLNLVNGHLQLLMAQRDISDKARERLSTIHTQITRVGDIVRKLLVNTRPAEHHPEPIPFQELVADLEKLWNPTLANHGVFFRAYLPEPCVLLVDRKQMEQLFLNLVNNAVDAMPEGGRIQLRISRSDEDPARFSVALEDTGSGIPEELLSKVFRPLFTTKPEGKGTGLGLAICREIVRTHGGEIRMQSQVGLGTTVLFTLPGQA